MKGKRRRIGGKETDGVEENSKEESEKRCEKEDGTAQGSEAGKANWKGTFYLSIFAWLT